MEQPSEELRNGDVLLRRWHRGDVDAVHRAVTESLDHLRPFMVWVGNGYDRQSAVTFLEDSTVQWADRTAFGYAILTPSGELIGSCGLMARIGPGGLEIGYWVHKDHTRRGVATRAAGALRDEAFRIGADYVEIVHDLANQASGAVPKRLGFTLVEQRPATKPKTPGATGVDVVWRHYRPVTPPTE